MAAGGQVLLDAPVFEAVRARDQELAAVRAGGLDASLLRAKPQGWLARKLMRR